MTLLLLFLLLCLASVFTPLTQSSPATISDCDRVATLFLENNNETLAQCCNRSLAEYLAIECDDTQGSTITGLAYNGQSGTSRCREDTIATLAGFSGLESLRLDYYVDQTSCPSIFASLKNLTQLSTLSLQGAKLNLPIRRRKSSSAFINVTLDKVKTLDLSYSNLTFIPNWMFPQLSTLTFRGTTIISDSRICTNNATSLEQLFLDLTLPAISSKNQLSNCTNLTHLDLRLITTTESPSFDLSNWLQPVSQLTQLTNLSIIVVQTSPSFSTLFPTWITKLSNLSSLTYKARVSDELRDNVLNQLPLVSLDMSENNLYGNLPAALSNSQLLALNLTGNQLSGNIPDSFGNTTSCDLSGNPILCAGIGNRWSLCQHCNLIPSFADILRRYMYQWIILGACLILVLCAWIYVYWRRHQRTSVLIWLGVIYSVFSAVNLFTTIVHLGLNVSRYRISFGLMLGTTVLYLGFNAYLYRYCCRRFKILIIRRTWPVFGLCMLDLNNFKLYEIRALNLSAYRQPIDQRVPVVLSWVKVILADIAHIAITIFLLMLHSPVASVLLTCITSGIGLLRGICQAFELSSCSRHAVKYQPMASSSLQITPAASSRTSSSSPEQTHLIKQ